MVGCVKEDSKRGGRRQEKRGLQGGQKTISWISDQPLPLPLRAFMKNAAPLRMKLNPLFLSHHEELSWVRNLSRNSFILHSFVINYVLLYMLAPLVHGIMIDNIYHIKCSITNSVGSCEDGQNSGSVGK